MATPLTPAQQLQQLQQQFNARWGNNVSAADYRSGAYDRAREQFMAQQQALSNQESTSRAAAAAANDPVQKAKDEMYGLARGAVNTKNPIDQQILAMLQERSGKDAGPFDAATRNALMTQASDAAGYAALQAKGRISGNAGDASVMAANNEADARRAQAIQQAQLGINTQANVANYDARGQAIGQLGNYNQQVIHNQTDNERWLMHLLSQETQYQPDGGSGGIPSFQQFSIGGPARQVSQPAPQAWHGFTNGGTYNQTPGYVAPRAPTTVAPVAQPPTTQQPAAQPQPTTTTKVVAPVATTQPQQPQYGMFGKNFPIPANYTGL